MSENGDIACSSVALLDTQLGLFGQGFRLAGAEKVDDDMVSMRKIKKAFIRFI